MGMDAPCDVAIETSTLINFLRIGRVDLLAGLTAYRFAVTDNIGAEVLKSYPVEFANLALALEDGHLHEISLTDPAELSEYVALKKPDVLGDGECSAIAVAYVRGLPLAMDDRTARSKTTDRYPSVVLLDTVGLMIEAIRARLLTVEEADAIKADWANRKFKKPYFKSFGELLF
jgi:predicted nucleic acid-binding protein